MGSFVWTLVVSAAIYGLCVAGISAYQSYKEDSGTRQVMVCDLVEKGADGTVWSCRDKAGVFFVSRKAAN